MQLWRVLFQDNDSQEYYQRWFADEDQADTDAEKLVSDKITWWTAVDSVELPTVGDRITRYNVLNLLNEHALVATYGPTKQ